VSFSRVALTGASGVWTQPPPGAGARSLPRGDWSKILDTTQSDAPQKSSWDSASATPARAITSNVALSAARRTS